MKIIKQKITKDDLISLFKRIDPNNKRTGIACKSSAFHEKLKDIITDIFYDFYLKNPISYDDYFYVLWYVRDIKRFGMIYIKKEKLYNDDIIIDSFDDLINLIQK